MRIFLEKDPQEKGGSFSPKMGDVGVLLGWENFVQEKGRFISTKDENSQKFSGMHCLGESPENFSREK